MERLGFIRDMMDVKVLILFVAARSNYPMTMQQVYELCYQDDCVSYFDVCQAIMEMVKSGHLNQLEGDRFEITDKGRRDGEVTADSVAFTVKQRAERAVEKFNRQQRRSNYIRTQVVPGADGDFSAVMSLDDEHGNLMTLELVAPNQRQAYRLTQMFERKAEFIYNITLEELLVEEENLEE